MNDTQFNGRQVKFLNYLLTKPLASREELKTSLAGQNVSRITVIRDLNLLLKLGWIEQSGGGKYIKYSLKPDREIFVPVNLDDYFSVPQDQRNVRYLKFNVNLIKKLTNLFTKDERVIFEHGKLKLKEKLTSLDKTILKRELERFTIELSWKSSQIEGNTYSLLETEELIKNRREARGHNREEAIMILNHKSAFDTILENRESFRKIDISDIRTIHSALTHNLGIKTNIRESAVGITGTKYLPPDNKYQIEDVLNRLVERLTKTTDVPEKALVLMTMISYLQPFVDGNKRTARMVSNAILLANDYYPLSYRSIDEVEYKKALILFYEQNNIYHLKRLFLEQQQFAIDNYFL